MADLVGPKDVAAVLGVAEREVYRLVRAGMPKAARGKYDPVACGRWYLKTVLAPTNGKAPELGASRLRKARALAVRAERKVQLRQEEVLASAAWAEQEREVVEWLRSEVLALAPAWAVALDGAKDAREAWARLWKLTREALERLHQTGPPPGGGGS